MKNKNKYSCLACGKYITTNKNGDRHKHYILGTKEECVMANIWKEVKHDDN